VTELAPPPSYIPPEAVEEWQTLIADLIWWFHGFEAVASKRQREHLPDLGRLRQMRTDVFRVADNKPALATINRELPF